LILTSKDLRMLKLSINGKSHQVDVEPEMPLLWVLRDQLGMMGTKFGCGIAQCGACTVHVNGEPMRSCSYPVSAAVGSQVGNGSGTTAAMLGGAAVGAAVGANAPTRSN
jgi:isoquinoline 1-oxidoreductase alpha subunit